MSRYTNKFVEFLNGSNTIIIRGIKDFNSLKSLVKKVGLDFFKEDFDYYELIHLAQINNCLIGCSSVIVEYQPQGGFTIGYNSVQDSERWYGLNPYTMDEVRASMS